MTQPYTKLGKLSIVKKAIDRKIGNNQPNTQGILRKNFYFHPKVILFSLERNFFFYRIPVLARYHFKGSLIKLSLLCCLARTEGK